MPEELPKPKKWTVHCTDTFDGTYWCKEFDTESAAMAYAKAKGGTMLRAHVENPDGKRVRSEGTF